MNRKCAFCGKTSDLFTLTFEPDETDAGERFTSWVCGKHWEHIATISRRAMKKEIDEIRGEINELRLAMPSGRPDYEY